MSRLRLYRVSCSHLSYNYLRFPSGRSLLLATTYLLLQMWLRLRRSCMGPGIIVVLKKKKDKSSVYVQEMVPGVQTGAAVSARSARLRVTTALQCTTTHSVPTYSYSSSLSKSALVVSSVLRSPPPHLIASHPTCQEGGHCLLCGDIPLQLTLFNSMQKDSTADIPSEVGFLRMV